MKAMWIRAALALCVVFPAHAADPATPTEVVVLATLHQYHPKVPRYGYADLGAAVEQLQPHVLALQLTAEDIASRAPQRTRQEYPQSIYPLLERHSYFTVALEPSGARRAALLDKLVTADRAFTRSAPEQARAFEAFGSQLFSYLLENWRSACDVNSAQTDALMEVKHRFQDAITPADQAAAWDGWNQHFLGQIKRAATAHPGKRVVALVGVEHAYWLRAQLREQPGLRLMDAAGLLKAQEGRCG
jgi:hypothetical protein